MKYFVLSLLFSALNLLLISNAYAIDVQGSGGGSAQCVRPAEDCQCTEGIFGILISDIMEMIKDVHQKLYEGILESGLQEIAGAVVLLFVVMTGVLFVMGMIQLNLAEITKRSLKLILVGALMSSGGWALFNETAVPLFTEGRDQIIQVMTETLRDQLAGGAFGGGCNIDMGAAPVGMTSLQESARKVFEPIDGIIMKIICPQTMILFEAAINSSVYGLWFGGGYAIIALFLLMAFARALWVYLIATLGTFLLLGLAPFFILSVLFERTKSFFTNWLNFLVSFSLQPIFMFTGITFFVLLMQTPLEQNILTNAATQGRIDWSTQGGSSENRGWVLAEYETCEPYYVEWNIQGCEAYVADTGAEKDCDAAGIPESDFPLDIMDIIVMLILAFICFKFYDQVIQLAQDIAGQFLSLETGSPVESAMKGISDTAQSAVSGFITSGKLPGSK